MAMKQFGVVFTILAIISLAFGGVWIQESIAACNELPRLGVDWSNCDKTNADLTGATLTDANLYGAILKGANLTNANLYGAILSRANLTDAVLTNASLSEATLTDSILYGADLTKAGMYNATLYGAILTVANLSAADLTNANLTNAVLTNAVLTNAILYGATLYSANLTGANLTNVDLTNANLTNAVLTNAVLSNAVLKNATLHGVNLSGATLTGVSLSNANLTNADLSYADMTNIALNGTNLTKTNLTGVRGLSRDNTDGSTNQNNVIWDNTTCPDGSDSSSRKPQTCFPAPEPDKYEPDNTFDTAKLILLNPMIPENLLPSGYEWRQSHNFYSYGDEDWVKFYVNKDNYYRLSVNSPGKNCDPVIEIYDSNRQLIMTQDDYMEGHSEYAEFLAQSDGIHYFRIRQCDIREPYCHASYGEGTDYYLTVIAPYVSSLGLIEISNLPVGIDVTINTPYWKDRKISTQTGTFFDWHTPGTYTMSAKAEGYESCTQQINVREFDKTIEKTAVNICLKPIVSAKKDKAVIVAGGGYYPANELWKATKLCTNFAFLSLLSQGYSKENIYYLSSESIDADGDGMNDVDADATNDNLSYAINEWAKDAADLILYMVDHGGDSLFQINGTKNPVETISADTLDNWLDNLQMTMPGKLIFVYDACRSGSFLSMKAPEGKERIIITASSANERAWHLNDGILSFSYQFWASVFVKGSLYSSFVDAKNIMKNDQTACLDANGNGICSESDKEDQRLAADIIIGKGRIAASTPPVIGKIVGEQVLNGEKSAKLWAGSISSFNRINRIWAVIVPPDYDILSPNQPVTDLPIVELRDSDQDGVYECGYDKFTRHGTYKINIYATDTEGSYAVPQQTTVVQTKGNSCISVSSNLAFNICAEYHAVKFGFTLKLDNAAQLLWKADIGTFRELQSDPGSCISVGDDLKLDMCAEYQGKNFGFTMNYDRDAMWKMDIGTFREIQ
jgi:uncharacterized protein YjbI with pentapeptide repeats